MDLKSLNLLFFFTGGVTRTITILLSFIAVDLGLSLSEVGFARGVLGISKIVLTIPIVLLANKFNNRKLVFLSIAIYSFSLALISSISSYPLLIILYLISSLGFALYSPLTKAEVADNATNENRGKVISNYASSGELGGIVFTTVFGYLAVLIGWRMSNLLMTILPIIAMIYVNFRLKKIKTNEVKVKTTPHINYKILLKNKRLIYSLLCSLLDNFASANVILFIPFLLRFYNYGDAYIPLISGFALVGSFIGKFFSGRLSDKFSTGTVFVASEIIMAFLVVLMGVTSNIIILLVASILLGIVTKGTVPVYQTMVGESVPREHNKQAFGLEILTNNLGGLISAVFFGLIGDVLGVPAIFIGFGICAIIAAIPGILYRRSRAIIY